jgi:branched-chain amino acid transport system substrate-binding protein
VTVQRKRAGVVGFGVAVVGTLVLALGLPGAGAATNDPGVSKKSITMGYIYSGTGAAASTFRTAGDACKARVDRENANGGVNGRKIKLVIEDDQSGAGNLTATKDLIQNKNAFVIVNNSSFAFLSYRTMLENGVPMIGGGYDGDYYGRPGNESIFSTIGAPFVGLTTDMPVKVMKQLGATKVAALAYGASPSSTASAKALQQYAVPSNGLKDVYTNTTVDFGSTDVGPLVLGIKNSGADAAYLPLVAGSNLAVVQGLQQNSVPMKAILMPTGYGQDLLDQPASKTMTAADVFYSQWQPVELKTKATKRFQSDLKKYVGITGVPDFGDYTGYTACELAILGLRQAGKTPTRDGFVSGLRALGTYDAAGLNCEPINISSTNYGKFPLQQCTYTITIKNGKFVVGNKGKPVKGKLVGDPAAVEANTYDLNASSGATTTTK